MKSKREQYHSKSVEESYMRTPLYMKTFNSSVQLHLPYIHFSLLGFTIWKDLNDNNFIEYRFLGYKIK